MPTTLLLPDWLDDAELGSFLRTEAQPVIEGQPIATFVLDGKPVELPATVGGTLLRRLVEIGTSCSAGMPLALVGEPTEDIGWHPAHVRSVRLGILTSCSECGSDFPVNGLVASARCLRCGADKRLPPTFWRRYETELNIARRNLGAKSGSTWGVPPLCRACHALIPMNAVVEAWNAAHRGEPAAVACAACDESYAARLPPPWARQVFPQLIFLLGEVVAHPTGTPARPVVLQCPACSASLQIGGEKRIVRCRYCDADVYLPADLWLHLHPSARRTRWWMVFSG
jgi:pyruvate/2-oxoglutarate dehydrogenase complex dihydrolipoamide acyltransferase (E2) component